MYTANSYVKAAFERSSIETKELIDTLKQQQEDNSRWFRPEACAKGLIIGIILTTTISIIGLVYHANFSGTFTELQIGWMVLGALFLSIFFTIKWLTTSYWWAIIICIGVLGLMVGSLLLLGIAAIGIGIKLIWR